MNKNRFVFPMLLVSLFSISLSSCNDNKNSSPVVSTPGSETPSSPEKPSESTKPSESVKPSSPVVSSPIENPGNQKEMIVFHYINEESQDYENYDVWTWDWKGAEDIALDWTGTDDYGAYVVLDPENYEDPEKIGILVRNRGDWGDFQTLDVYIERAKYEKSAEDGNIHVYGVLGARKEMLLFTNTKSALGDRVRTADFTSFDNIYLTASNPVSNYTVYENGSVIFEGTVATKDKFNIKLNNKIIPHNTYKVKVTFAESKTQAEIAVSCNQIFDTQDFLNNYTYTGQAPLGVSFVDGKTVFRTWAPLCSSVAVNVYKYGTPTSVDKNLGNNTRLKRIPLERKEQGIYEASVDGDLSGNYYTFTVNNYSGAFEIVDPYAISTGINGKRGFIYNLDRPEAKPLGWDNINFKPINSNKELTVYELHVADLTYDKTWTGTERNRGTYAGLAERGTSYTENGVTVTTGYDHINELGVSAVQLLPFFDYANDERSLEENYNWGYNPENYNAPEGIYSTNPYDGLTKIVELRNAILALSKTDVGTRTIMDVVYNHMNNAYNSNFHIMTPGYFFRYDADGALSNGSGCGNEFKTEAPMARRFIKDSLVHWADNYQIKGFRFDLMGLIDCLTLKEAAEELYKVDPSITCYGEGWIAMGDWGQAVANLQAVNDNIYQYLYAYEEGNPTDKPDWDTKSRIAVGGFNDQSRDGMRGANNGGNNLPGDGFISEGWDAGKVTDMIKGMHPGKGGNPTQTVNYLSCHDNFTIFDQLNYNIGNGKVEPELSLIGDAVVSAYSAVLLSQGIAFLHGGDEFLRTKIEEVGPDGEYQGDEKGMVEMYGKVISHNSYKSAPKTNAFHYDRKIEVKETYDKFVEAIHLRNSLSDTVLNYQFPDNCDTTKLYNWEASLDRGYGVGINYAGKDFYILSLANINSATGTIPVGNGQLKVLYSSNNTYQVGQIIDITDNSITLSKFETVLVQRVA